MFYIYILNKPLKSKLIFSPLEIYCFPKVSESRDLGSGLCRQMRITYLVFISNPLIPMQNNVSRTSRCVPLSPAPSRYLQLSPGVLRYVKVFPGMSRCSQVCPGVPSYVQVSPGVSRCPYMSRCFHVCPCDSSHAHVIPAMSRCFQLCPCVSSCVQVFPGASIVFQGVFRFLPGKSWSVSMTFQVFPGVPSGFQVFPDVSMTFQMYPGMSRFPRCFNDLPGVSRHLQRSKACSRPVRTQADD